MLDFFKNNTPFVPGAQRFLRIDSAGIATKIKLEERAASRGKENLPRESAAQLDEVEVEINNQINEAKKFAYDEAVKELQSYKERITQLKLTNILSEALDYASRAISDLKAKQHEGESEFYKLKSSVEASSQELINFRKKNNLELREANFPKTKVLHFAILLFLFTIESAVNGVFLAEGSTFGLVGGVAEAIAYALLNVFVPVIIFARFVRYMWHVSWVFKIVGIITMLTYVAFVLCLNGMLAHYRLAQEMLLDNAHQAAFEAFTTNFISFSDTKSVAFFAMGLAFGFISLLDALSMDDLYPGYGDVSRRKDEALEDYLELKKDLIEEFQIIRDEAVKEVNDKEEIVEMRMEKFHELMGNRKTMHNEFVQYMVYLNDRFQELITRYRSLNIEHRTEPAPAYFKVEVKWEAPELQEDDPRLEEKSNTLRDDIKRDLKKLSKKRKEIHETFDMVVKKIRALESVSAGTKM